MDDNFEMIPFHSFDIYQEMFDFMSKKERKIFLLEEK